MNATDHWSLLVCDPSLATALEEDSVEVATTSLPNSQNVEENSETSENTSETSEEDEDEDLSAADPTIDEDGIGEASNVPVNEEHTIDEDVNVWTSEDDSSLNRHFTIDIDSIRARHLDEHSSVHNTAYSDDQSDREEQEEIKKARSLIGHIKQDLLCYGWAFHKDRLGFGFTCARPEEVRSDDSIYEREMHLCILRTCRQVYTEATQVLWETNIFSFNDVNSYHRFMDSRNASQMGSIRKLRLAMDWTLNEGIDWESILAQAAGSLLGLRELWLSINHIPGTEDTAYIFGQLSLRQIFAAKGFPIALIGLATLPLNRVEVAFYSRDLRDYMGYLSRAVWERPAWDEQERQDYAEVVREMLLSPKGADLPRQEADKYRFRP